MVAQAGIEYYAVHHDNTRASNHHDDDRHYEGPGGLWASIAAQTAGDDETQLTFMCGTNITHHHDMQRRTRHPFN